MKKIIVLIMVCIMLYGCKGSSSPSGDDSQIFYYTDSKTGVQYVIFGGLYRGGICPRYNADGTLMIGEE